MQSEKQSAEPITEEEHLSNGAFNGYLVLFGLVLILIGIIVAASSIGMISGYSELSDAALRLFVGGFFAVAGVVLFLMGFLSAKRGTRYLYY